MDPLAWAGGQAFFRDPLGLGHDATPAATGADAFSAARRAIMRFNLLGHVPGGALRIGFSYAFSASFRCFLVY